MCALTHALSYYPCLQSGVFRYSITFWAWFWCAGPVFSREECKLGRNFMNSHFLTLFCFLSSCLFTCLFQFVIAHVYFLVLKKEMAPNATNSKIQFGHTKNIFVRALVDHRPTKVYLLWKKLFQTPPKISWGTPNASNLAFYGFTIMKFLFANFSGSGALFA